MREEDRAWGIDFDRQGDERRQHSSDSQPHKGAEDIDDPLDEKPAVIEGAGFIRKHGKASEGFCRLVGDDIIKIIDVDMNGDAHTFKADDKLFNLLPGIVGKMDEDLVDDPGFQLLIEICAAGGYRHAPDFASASAVS